MLTRTSFRLFMMLSTLCPEGQDNTKKKNDQNLMLSVAIPETSYEHQRHQTVSSRCHNSVVYFYKLLLRLRIRS